MIPGGKTVTTAGKVVKGAVGLAKEVGTVSRIAKGAHEAEEVAKAAKLAKEAEEAAAASKKAKKDTTVKKQKPDKDCGKISKYSKAPKKLGLLNADHIPSGAALKAVAEKKLKEMKLLEHLDDKQIKSILDKEYNNALTITIPEDVHKEGRTWGSKNRPLIDSDSKDLKGAFEKDAKAVQKSMDSKDHGCSEEYAKAVKELRKFDYDKYIEEAVKTHKAVKALI